MILASTEKLKLFPSHWRVELPSFMKYLDKLTLVMICPSTSAVECIYGIMHSKKMTVSLSPLNPSACFLHGICLTRLAILMKFGKIDKSSYWEWVNMSPLLPYDKNLLFCLSTHLHNQLQWSLKPWVKKYIWRDKQNQVWTKILVSANKLSFCIERRL